MILLEIKDQVTEMQVFTTKMYRGVGGRGEGGGLLQNLVFSGGGLIEGPA